MSGLKVFEANDVKVYNLTAGREVPSWLSERKRRQLLKKDPDLKRRVQLVQDFEFPTACNTLAISPDQQYVLASGTYKPRVRCFELSQMSMKFERYLNCEAVKFHMLSEDYTKFAMLLADRYIELHAAGGVHYRTRVPNYGRDLAYFKPTADLLIAGQDHVYPLNLCEGRFKEPFYCKDTMFTNLDLNPVHGLLAAGTAHAGVQCFDPRASASPLSGLDVMRGIPPSTQRRIKGVPEVTSLRFQRNGLGLAVGLSSGQVLMYDIRSTKPVLVKDHNYGLPITYIYEHELTDNMLSVDRKGVKFWNKESGTNHLAFEADAEVSAAAMFPESGLFFLGGEQSKIMSYFIPSLGPAPKWCGYLDTIADELDEEEQPVVYDDYKFVTREELGRLGLSDLVGTGMLRAHMHGFFVDTRLYNEAVEALNPFAHEEYRRQKIKEQLEKGTRSRLQLERLRLKLPKVNRQLATKIMAFKGVKAEKDIKAQLQTKMQEAQEQLQQQGENDGGETPGSELAKKAAAEREAAVKKALSVNDLVDSRFAAMFTNKDFEVDQRAEEYKAWQRGGTRLQREVNERMEDIDEMLEDEDDESGPEGRGSDDEEEEAALVQDLLGVARDGDASDAEDEKIEEAFEQRRRKKLEARRRKEGRRKAAKDKRSGPRLQAGQGDVDIAPMQTSGASKARQKAKATTFAKLLETTAKAEQVEEGPAALRNVRRVAGGKVAHISMRKGGSKAGDKTPEQRREEERQRRQNKRGVRSLKLSKPNTAVYWRGRKIRD